MTSLTQPPMCPSPLFSTIEWSLLVSSAISMESELFLGTQKHPVLISYVNAEQSSKVRPVGHATHMNVAGKTI